MLNTFVIKAKRLEFLDYLELWIRSVGLANAQRLKDFYLDVALHETALSVELMVMTRQLPHNLRLVILGSEFIGMVAAKDRMLMRHDQRWRYHIGISVVDGTRWEDDFPFTVGYARLRAPVAQKTA